MKRYIYIIMVFLSVSCNGYLDVVPEGSATFNNFFRTGQDAEALLASMMAHVRTAGGSSDEVHISAGLKVDKLVNDYQSDIVRGARQLAPKIYFGAWWKTFYDAIHDADLMLDNAYRFELPEETVDIYRQQSYFVKGLCYFWIGRAWGEAPIVPNSESIQMKLGKSSAQQVMEEATKWALKAMDLPKYEDLKDYNGNSRSTKQYASKGAAAALLANIYAWRANLENNKEFWVEAEKYCTMIIENKVGTYGLAANPEDVCKRVFKGGSEESIYELYRTFTNPGEFTEFAYSGEQFVGWPTRTDMSVSFDGYPDILEFTKTTINGLYPREDLRRQSYFYGIDSTVFHVKGFGFNEETGEWGDMVIVKDYTKMEKVYCQPFRFPYYTLNGYDNEKIYNGMEMPTVVWRLADIMLLRAECRFRGGLPGVMDDVVAVRERAGLTGANLTYDFDGDVQLAIFRERERELLFENTRYYDAVRNGVRFIREELPPAFGRLTDTDIQNGALYYPVYAYSMLNNDLILQNIYWNTKAQ